MAAAGLIERTVHAATHPLSTAGYVVGLARGSAGAVLRALGWSGGPAHAEWIAPPVVPTEEPEPLLPDAPPAAVQRSPEPPHESFATEASAVSRDSAHGGSRRGVAGDADIDDWYADAEDPELNDLPDGVVEALELGDPPTKGR